MPCFLSVLGFNMEEYRTVEKFGEDFFIEKKSKFIGYACPVKSRQEADDFISKIKAKHWDATHNVYAYTLRENNIQRYSDDGEPSGTAGVPVLDVILKEGLVDVCVVATRYFGGTLLGTGGLVRAYTAAAQSALSGAEILSYSLCVDLEINIDYPLYDRVVALCRSDGGKVIDTVYAENVKLKVRMVSGTQQKLIDDLMPLTKGKIPHVSDEFYEIF